MYSVVLLMAVTSGGEAAEYGRRGCNGCAAGRGGCFVSNGCAARCGGRARRSRCHGGGSCGGYYVSGCYGGGYGGGCASYGGGYAYGGGCASYGGYAGGGCASYGGGYVSGGGCASYGAGVVYGASAGVAYSGCTAGGVVSGHAGHGGVVYSGTVGGTVVETATAESDELKPGTTLSTNEQTMLKEMMDAEKNATERAKIEEEFKKDTRAGRKATYEVFKKAQSNKDETTATIIVTVPATATVKIDGENTLSTSTLRRFESPALAKGKTYSYTFVAEYQDAGQPVTVQKKVSFQAGKVVRLDLTNGATAVASK